MPHWRLPITEKPTPGSLRDVVDPFLSPSVLWLFFGIFIAASGVMLGLSFNNTTSGHLTNDNCTPDDSCTTGGTRLDGNFYNLMSQVCITILACYCALIPVLHVPFNGSVDLKVNVAVFYLTTTLTLCTAVAAPVVYVTCGSGYEDTSNALNFVSSVSSVITASQLAAGVLKLDS